MTALRRFGFLIVLLLPSILIAQDQKADDAAKEKLRRRSALIEQIVADLPNLKLGENRALVYAKVGNLVWDTDQKQALKLFQNAVGELISAQNLAEANRRPSANQNELLTGGSIRPQILNTIASRNAELALEMLVRTRPAAIAKALSMQTAKPTKISNAANLSYLAQNEVNLEHTFIRMAADQNPDRAAKLLKESLAKGISNESLNLLKKLAEKDREAANELGSAFVDKLIESKFTIDEQPNYQYLQVSAAFLNEFLAEKKTTAPALKLDDSQMHRLAEKLFSFYLDQGNQSGYFDYSVVAIAEKLSPSIVEQLKKLMKNSRRWGDYGGYDPDIQKLLGSDATADQLLSEAKKYPTNLQRQIYQTAANKLVQQGNLTRATDVINDNFSDDARDEVLRNLNSQYSYNLMSAGKFSEAERLIDEFPENVRIGSLVNLANAIFQKDSENNKPYALAVLAKARDLIREDPENSTEMSSLSLIIAAYANIEPIEAFRMYELLIPQMNELTDAASVLNGFQGNNNVRNREFLLSQGNSFGFYGADFSVLWTFGRSDFDRTIRIIDAFTHREVRIALKIQMVESGLN